MFLEAMCIISVRGQFSVFDNIFVCVYNLCTHLVSLTLSTTEPSFSERNMFSFKDVRWITQLAAADVLGGAFVRQYVEARVDTTLETCLGMCVICFQVEVRLPPTTVFFMFSFNSDQGETALWYFTAIGELKLELSSGNPQIRAKSLIFQPVWLWNLMDDLEK